MPTFATGVVRTIERARDGVQWLTVEVAAVAGAEPVIQSAYVLTDLVGPAEPGDQVQLNTTAVERGLGTGGAHVVVVNLSRSHHGELGPGHVMKARYTPHQVDTGVWDEDAPTSLDVAARPFAGPRLVLCTLLSHAAAVAVGVRHERADARIGLVMTDGGALPLAHSDLIATLVERSVLDVTATAGQAFGGQVEAVNVPSAVEALIDEGCDVIVASIGPGHVGTGSTLGFSSLDLAGHAAVLSALGAEVALALRASDADGRDRHRGLSHHSATLARLTPSDVVLPVPRKHPEVAREALPGLERRIVDLSPVWIADACAATGIEISSMGRNLVDDHLAVTHLGAAARWACDAHHHAR